MTSPNYEQRARAIAEYITVSADNFTKLRNECLAPINDCVGLICERLAAGNKVLIAGNGGSAADAMHIAAELVGRFRLERRAMPCIALNTNASIMTAVGNDYGFDDIFSRQVEALGKSGDVFIGISTSGNSPNIVRALAAARAADVSTVGMTGAGGGRMASEKLCDILIAVPSKVTSNVQEMHIACGHAICMLVEEIMRERMNG